MFRSQNGMEFEQVQHQSPQDWLNAKEPVSYAQKAAEHRYWVEMVKSAQKSGVELRTQWRDYCDAFGSGTRDPRLHDSAFLQRFFTLRAEGGIPVLTPPDHERPVPEGREDQEAHTILVAKVKQAQRNGPAWGLWIRHSDACGLSRTPLGHSCASLRHFLDQVDPSICRDPFSAPAAFGPSPLSDSIKRMQSMKLKWKHQWDAFCENFGRGVRDPERHPQDFLLSFLQTVEPKPDMGSLFHGLEKLAVEVACDALRAFPDPPRMEYDPRAPATIPFHSSTQASQSSHLPQWLQPSEGEPMGLAMCLQLPSRKPCGLADRMAWSGSLKTGFMRRGPPAKVMSCSPAAADMQPQQSFSVRKLQVFSV